MFDIDYFLACFAKLAPALPMTLLLAGLSFFIGCFVGIVFALIRLYKLPILNPLIVIFVSFFRGTPLLVQLFVFFYGLPIFLQDLDINFALLDAIYYALIVFSLYASAYLTELFRSAFLAVNKGQIEAAYSVGMSGFQALRRIILPQALMIALPNLLNFFILQVKNTALASVITVPELMGVADIESGRTSKFLEVYVMAALMYWALCIFLEYLFTVIEKYFAKFRKGYA